MKVQNTATLFILLYFLNLLFSKTVMVCMAVIYWLSRLFIYKAVHRKRATDRGAAVCQGCSPGMWLVI